jgi:hypothetical protein
VLGEHGHEARRAQLRGLLADEDHALAREHEHEHRERDRRLGRRDHPLVHEGAGGALPELEEARAEVAPASVAEGEGLLRVHLAEREAARDLGAERDGLVDREGEGVDQRKERGGHMRRPYPT